MVSYLRKFWAVYLFTGAVFIALAIGGSRVVTAFSENAPIERKNLVIIDAGHGGEDGGATSCTGVLESSLNLEIALRLNDLMHLLGYETQMIRTTDTAVSTEGKTIAARKASDLRNRVKTVNETENALLVSIHQNLFADSRYSGAQVFYNSVDGAKELAQTLQENLVSTINPGSNRQIKAANGVYLMTHSQKPSILVECGFLSNPQEEQKLRQAEYQQNLCCVFAVTLSQYFTS